MIYSIIPAGGAGTRLWPLSRRNHPKFLTDLTGAGRTLIQQTVDRLTKVSRSTMIVTGVAHANAVRAQLTEIPRENVIAEPFAPSSLVPQAVPERCPRFSPKIQDTRRTSSLRHSGHAEGAGTPWKRAAATSRESASRSRVTGVSPSRQRASSRFRASVWSTSSCHLITRTG